MHATTNSQEKQPQGLTGIGGWLLLYLVLQALNILFFLGGVVTTGTAVYDLSNAALAKELSNIQGILLPFNLISVAFLTISLFFIMLGRQNAIRATVIILSINVGMALAYGILSARAMLILGSQYGITPALVGVLVGLTYNGFWIRYFMCSQRVKRTLTR